MGTDFADAVDANPNSEKPNRRANQKAQYKGLDDSEVDPDYVRPPPIPAFYAFQNPDAFPQTFPSLGQAYGPRPINPSRRNNRNSP